MTAPFRQEPPQFRYALGVKLAAEAIRLLVIDQAADELALDQALRDNNEAIAWIGAQAPPLWQALKTRTLERRAAFRAGRV
jgi:hypothetical protein